MNATTEEIVYNFIDSLIELDQLKGKRRSIELLADGLPRIAFDVRESYSEIGIIVNIYWISGQGVKQNYAFEVLPK